MSRTVTGITTASGVNYDDLAGQEEDEAPVRITPSYTTGRSVREPTLLIQSNSNAATNVRSVRATIRIPGESTLQADLRLSPDSNLEDIQTKLAEASVPLNRDFATTVQVRIQNVATGATVEFPAEMTLGQALALVSATTLPEVTVLATVKRLVPSRAASTPAVTAQSLEELVTRRFEREERFKYRGMTQEEYQAQFNRETAESTFKPTKLMRDTSAHLIDMRLLVARLIALISDQQEGMAINQDEFDDVLAWIVDSASMNGRYRQALDVVEGEILSGRNVPPEAADLDARAITDIFALIDDAITQTDERNRGLVEEADSRPNSYFVVNGSDISVSTGDRPKPSTRVRLADDTDLDCREAGFVWEYDFPAPSEGKQVMVADGSEFAMGGPGYKSLPNSWDFDVTGSLYGFARVNQNATTGWFAENPGEPVDVTQATVIPLGKVSAQGVLVDRSPEDGGPFYVKYGRPVAYYCLDSEGKTQRFPLDRVVDIIPPTNQQGGQNGEEGGPYYTRDFEIALKAARAATIASVYDQINNNNFKNHQNEIYERLMDEVDEAIQRENLEEEGASSNGEEQEENAVEGQGFVIVDESGNPIDQENYESALAEEDVAAERERKRRRRFIEEETLVGGNASEDEEMEEEVEEEEEGGATGEEGEESDEESDEEKYEYMDEDEWETEDEDDEDEEDRVKEEAEYGESVPLDKLTLQLSRAKEAQEALTEGLTMNLDPAERIVMSQRLEAVRHETAMLMRNARQQAHPNDWIAAYVQDVLRNNRAYAYDQLIARTSSLVESGVEKENVRPIESAAREIDQVLANGQNYGIIKLGDSGYYALSQSDPELVAQWLVNYEGMSLEDARAIVER